MDVQEIRDYIAFELKVPDTAQAQYLRIVQAIISLEELPERIKLMESEPWHSLEMRKLLVDNYSVFFVIHNETVTVTDVLYSASDIDKRLSERYQ